MQPINNNERYGKIFKLLRIFKGLKIREVSKSTGLAELTIHKIEAGKSIPTLSTLTILLDYYEISGNKFMSMLENNPEGKAYWIEAIDEYLNN